VAGPWFAVHKNGADWQRLEQVWISNGKTDCRGKIEIRVELESDHKTQPTKKDELNKENY
jgi:hypothetical protein